MDKPQESDLTEFKMTLSQGVSSTLFGGGEILMPTPIASEGIKASAAQSSEERLKTGQVFLTNIIHDIAVANNLAVPPRLLPTPIASDGKGTGPADADRVTVQLRAINVLLPTVTTQESKTGPSQLKRNTPPLNAILPELHKTEISWGKFEPAIRRWEALTRPAPAPTKPDGKNGAHRLSAEFTEWMMGLPQGWVTAEDIGLKRNDQLKACGNGVVPQQAELALRILLQDITI
jgi:DNA (cytosine-5)-methyltransferase 1